MTYFPACIDADARIQERILSREQCQYWQITINQLNKMYLLKFYNTELQDYVIVRNFPTRQAAYDYVCTQPHDFYRIYEQE